MRVALFSKLFLPSTGGIETSSAMLARAWRDAGIDVRVVTSFPGPADYEGVPVVRNWTLPSLLAAARWSQVIVTNGYSRVVALAALWSRRPLVIMHQGYQFICSDGLGFRNRVFHGFAFGRDLSLAWKAGVPTGVKALATRAFDEAFRRAGHRVLHVVPSAHVGRRLRLPHAPVLYQPPNPEVLTAVNAQPWSEEARAQAYRSGDVCFFGRLVFEKGVDDLVRAFGSLARGDWGGRSADPPRLRIFGAGPERELIEQVGRELRLEDRVVVSGFLRGSELVETARRASVVVVPSRWEEPGATIVVELVMAGAAVIASAAGAPGEILRENGRLFRNGSVEDLARALRDHFCEGPIYPTPAPAAPWSFETIRDRSLDVLHRALSLA